MKNSWWVFEIYLENLACKLRVRNPSYFKFSTVCHLTQKVCNILIRIREVENNVVVVTKILYVTKNMSQNGTSSNLNMINELFKTDRSLIERLS